MTECAHNFINTAYGPKGVKVTCTACKADVTQPHHREIAKLYQGKNR